MNLNFDSRRGENVRVRKIGEGEKGINARDKQMSKYTNKKIHLMEFTWLYSNLVCKHSVNKITFRVS